MHILNDLRKQPFLLTVSLAAFIHSAWTFATMFAGIEPQMQLSFAWAAWWLPGAAIAFSVDIGILSIANRIRQGERSWSTIIVFIVLALGMAYAQFVFMSSHMPALPLAEGVRPAWRETVQLGRDSTIWVFPCLLPLALILYAFVEAKVKLPSENVSSVSQNIEIRQPNFDDTPKLGTPIPEIENRGQKQAFLPIFANGNGKHDGTD